MSHRRGYLQRGDQDAAAYCLTPQPGDFYGGWVTPNLDGAIKGAPGTRHW